MVSLKTMIHDNCKLSWVYRLYRRIAKDNQDNKDQNDTSTTRPTSTWLYYTTAIVEYADNTDDNNDMNNNYN